MVASSNLAWDTIVLLRSKVNKKAKAQPTEETATYCIGCLTELTHLDDDPNGDKNCVCAKCRAEDAHDFDIEPHVKFDRSGRRIDP